MNIEALMLFATDEVIFFYPNCRSLGEPVVAKNIKIRPPYLFLSEQWSPYAMLPRVSLCFLSLPPFSSGAGVVQRRSMSNTGLWG